MLDLFKFHNEFQIGKNLDRFGELVTQLLALHEKQLKTSEERLKELEDRITKLESRKSSPITTLCGPGGSGGFHPGPGPIPPIIMWEP